MFSLSPVLTVSCLFDVFTVSRPNSKLFTWCILKTINGFPVRMWCIHRWKTACYFYAQEFLWGFEWLASETHCFFVFFFRSGNAMTMFWHIHIDHHHIVTKWGLFRFLRECVMWVSVLRDVVSRNEILVGFVVLDL